MRSPRTHRGLAVAKKLLSKTIQIGDCWQWTGCIDNLGYGHTGANNEKHTVHIWSYETFIGPRITNLVIDHICNNRACINPLHLRMLTNEDNVMRGNGICAQNAKKNICKNGHALINENVKYKKSSKRKIRRECILCKKLADKKAYEKCLSVKELK